MTELERLLKETEDKYNFIENIKTRLPFDDSKRLIVYSTNSVHYDLIDYDKETSISLMFDIESEFTANKDNYIIEFSGRETIQTMHPAKVTIINPPIATIYSLFYIELSYYSENLRIVIKINIERFDSMIKKSTRKISTSERHYFPHTTFKKLKEMDVKCYKLNTSNYPELKVINWYGGNKTVYADTEEGKKEFENLLLFNIY